MVHRRLVRALRGRRWPPRSLVSSPSPADAAEGEWSPLQEAGRQHPRGRPGQPERPLWSASAARTRRPSTTSAARPTAALGPSTEVTTVEDAEYCRPVEAVTALGNVAVAVECQAKTGLEDPPTRLVELVWTGDDGWVWQVQPEGELGSLDYSPQGQYVVFTSNSQYGRPHHVTSYHADLGWRDLTRRELGSTGDDLVAAISDAGNVVALRGPGSRTSPATGSAAGSRIETYNSTTRKWTQRLTRDYPDGGIDPSGIDLAGGRVCATLVESRSTGKLNGLADQGRRCCPASPSDPRSWSSPDGTGRSSPRPRRSLGQGSGSPPGRRSRTGAPPRRGSRPGRATASSRPCTS